MPWQPAPPLPEIEVDAARVWAESGCQSLTHPDVPVPSRLVRTVAAVVAGLDAAGAGLAERYGACGLGALSERAGSLLFRPADRASCGGATRLLPAADGWIAVTLARPDDRRALPAWLGVDPESAFVVTNSDPWVEVARRVGERQSSELVDLAALLGLACAVVGETAPTAGVIVDHLGHAASRPFAGLRVANLASLWAGPLAADVLARLGADVVYVESTSRPDGSRAMRTWFDAMHTGQRSVAVDFRTDTGVAQLKSLLAAADVVIEGSRPRALQQLGISAEDSVVGWSAGVAVDHGLRPRSLAGDAGGIRRRRGGSRGTGGSRRGWAGVHRRCGRRSDHRPGGGEHDRRPDRRRRSLDRRHRPGSRRRGRRAAGLRPDRDSRRTARHRPAGSPQRPRSRSAPIPMPSSRNGRDGDHKDSIRRVRRSASYIGVA